MNLKYYFYELWSLFVDHGLPLIALLLIGILIPRIGRLAIRIMERRLDEEEEATKARLALTGALVYIVQAAAYFLIIWAALTNLGVPAVGAAVPATIVSAAVGFGAQSIIADFLSGFFILSEKQFGVGDYVSFDGVTDVEGTVVMLTLRTTKVRTPTGELVTVPNSSAGAVTNYSQEWSRAVVNFDVPVQEGETLPEITRRVRTISEQAIQEPSIAVDVNGELEVLPATQLVAPQAAGQSWHVTYRVLVTVNPARQWAVERAIRSALLSEFWDHYNVADLDEIQRPLLPAGDNAAAQESVKDASAAGEGSRPDSQPEHQSPEADGPDSDGPGKPALPDEEDHEPEPTQGIWRALETNSKFQKIATIGGRVRASTTGLILALLVVGALALASSNPENADAGWLSPEHWRDSGAEASSSQLSDAPSTNPTPETTETGTQYEPTEDSSAPTETANPQGSNGAGATDSPAGSGSGGGQETGATGNASPAPSAANGGTDSGNGAGTAPTAGSDAGDGTQASGTAGSTGQEIPAEPR
ncbi:mechanosensitive ion channel domain-containing protein [uncultured Corynebacterium sp.]|uniref:mechanosensitive ion channel domain-containing protein n=1 Tax=uncultured Corynebacterium sp. TaxID=159447 RepID=UPI0025E4935F|nr:mechanosensitive ion channel domain-containing protein [uncultured Corynebacterium sp.]